MKNLIEQTFANCKKENRVAFIAYIAAGDPSFEKSLKIVDSLVDAGIDILELGVPFSDPLADGSANQLAADRALQSGMTSLKVLELSKAIRTKYADLPIVLFTYMNPVSYIASVSLCEYCKKAVASGVNAILPLDVPPEEMDSEVSDGISFKTAIESANLANVVLIAPTTSEERIPQLANLANSFIYYVSKEGVTGEGNSFSGDFSTRIDCIKKYTDIPIVVGFGISTPEHVKTAASTGVDGVVVGSAIVRKVEAYAKNEATCDDIQTFVKSLTSQTCLD